MRRGDHLAARASLMPVYSSFEEGFETPDLREAGLLLEEMARLPVT
jgi:predicted ATPase